MFGFNTRKSITPMSNSYRPYIAHFPARVRRTVLLRAQDQTKHCRSTKHLPTGWSNFWRNQDTHFAVPIMSSENTKFIRHVAPDLLCCWIFSDYNALRGSTGRRSQHGVIPY
jgi:hypothetical protein